MNTKQIAQTLLGRRNSLSPVVMQGEMRDQLGSDGYSEAMRLGWLFPNYETGELHISSQQAVINDMRKVAESVTEAAQPPVVGDTVQVTDEDGTYAGLVQGVNADGTLKIAWTSNQKPKRERSWKPENTYVTKRTVAQAPTQTTTNSTSTPTPAPQQAPVQPSTPTR